VFKSSINMWQVFFSALGLLTWGEWCKSNCKICEGVKVGLFKRFTNAKIETD